jgi:hypothetical protein
MIDYYQFIETHHFSIDRKEEEKKKTFSEKYLQCNFVMYDAK